MLPFSTPDTWTSEPPMETLEALGIFVGIPVAIFVLIVVLVSAPSWIRDSTQRPGLSGWAAPQWFGARPESGADSGATDPTTTSEAEGSEGTRGGAGARW